MVEQEQILKAIATANDAQADAFLDAAFRRKEALHPDWELVYLALPKKDEAARRAVLENIQTLLNP